MSGTLRRFGAAAPSSPRRVLALVVALLALVALPLGGPAHAMKIQSVKSPGGIEAWLVEEHSVPLMAVRFSFEGGNSQDPVGKEGLANYLTAMLDEGAGDLVSRDFQERMEDIAMRMSFEDSRDAFYGSFETLTANRDKAAELLELALSKPRFDQDAVDRIRGQLQANLVYAARDPEKVALKAWYETAFDGHSYGRPANGTQETIGVMSREDLASYHARVFAKNTLKIVAVGDIDAVALGVFLDRVFGDLPAEANLLPVPPTTPVTGGKQRVIEMDVPQSVAVFGHGAMARKDPDFMAAFVINHIIGGGGFASQLMEEVREKRGLAYSVYTYLQPYKHTSILSGGVATKNEAIAESLDVIRSELSRMIENGPTATELENAKKYLTGSYALRFDSNAKIATQLLAILQEDLGIDYVDQRNQLVEAVTIEDARRVAKRLFKTGDLIVTIVGKPVNLPQRS